MLEVPTSEKARDGYKTQGHLPGTYRLRGCLFPLHRLFGFLNTRIRTRAAPVVLAAGFASSGVLCDPMRDGEAGARVLRTACRSLVGELVRAARRVSDVQ